MCDLSAMYVLSFGRLLWVVCDVSVLFGTCQALLTMKYHVIFKGRKTGVYSTWMECSHQVFGFLGNLHKSYGTKEEAEEALAMFQKLEQGVEDDARPRLDAVNKEKEVKVEGVNLSVKDVILCLLVVLVVFQWYLLYKL